MPPILEPYRGDPRNGEVGTASRACTYYIIYYIGDPRDTGLRCPRWHGLARVYVYILRRDHGLLAAEAHGLARVYVYI